MEGTCIRHHLGLQSLKMHDRGGRILKRLRLHGLVRRLDRTYRYHLTSLGWRAVITAR